MQRANTSSHSLSRVAVHIVLIDLLDPTVVPDSTSSPFLMCVCDQDLSSAGGCTLQPAHRQLQSGLATVTDIGYAFQRIFYEGHHLLAFQAGMIVRLVLYCS
jgi:hypothetical protein